MALVQQQQLIHGVYVDFKTGSNKHTPCLQVALNKMSDIGHGPYWKVRCFWYSAREDAKPCEIETWIYNRFCDAYNKMQHVCNVAFQGLNVSISITEVGTAVEVHTLGAANSRGQLRSYLKDLRSKIEPTPVKERRNRSRSHKAHRPRPNKSEGRLIADIL
jgi:hypothetical protein